MAFRRTRIFDFDLANPVYANATVTVYGVSGGAKDTSNVVTLYAGESGTTTLANPQKLDSDGKFAQPVYHDEPVVLQITNLRVADHDTGVVRPDIDDSDIANAEFRAAAIGGYVGAAELSAGKAKRSAEAAAASAASVTDDQIMLIAQSFG